jgi:hypothetical protein
MSIKTTYLLRILVDGRTFEEEEFYVEAHVKSHIDGWKRAWPQHSEKATFRAWILTSTEYPLENV